MKSIDKYIYSVIVILNKNQGDFTHGTGKKIKKHSFSRYARCHEESHDRNVGSIHIAAKPMYTYQIAQEVNRLTQSVLSYNTMYLAVYRLQENGFIEEAKKSIEDGRARIYLGITPSGQCYYDQLRKEYKLFTAALENLMNMDGHIYAEDKNG